MTVTWTLLQICIFLIADNDIEHILIPHTITQF